MPHVRELPSEIPLVEAAQRLGYRYGRALNAALSGELLARRQDNGRWLVREDSVRALERQKAGAREAIPA